MQYSKIRTSKCFSQKCFLVCLNWGTWLNIDWKQCFQSKVPGLIKAQRKIAIWRMVTWFFLVLGVNRAQRTSFLMLVRRNALLVTKKQNILVSFKINEFATTFACFVASCAYIYYLKHILILRTRIITNNFICVIISFISARNPYKTLHNMYIILYIINIWKIFSSRKFYVS